MNVMFGKENVELVGTPLSVGDQAKNFTVLDSNLQEKTLEDYTKDYLVISVIPSIDTGVCDYQTKTFNKTLNDFKNVQVLTISNDLPFAQKRWCANEGLKNVITLSDHRDLDFGLKYGTLMEKHRLQARAVFVLDKDRKVIYKEYVDNISDHPSYGEVETLLKERT